MENLSSSPKWDTRIVEKAKIWALPLSKLALFLVYFWFGALKVFTTEGAANPMVVALLNKTLPFISPSLFLIGFGIFEMFIGILFLIPRMEKIAIFFLALHIFTTILPLFILPAFTWHSFLIPTLEGQYIIKNIIIIALATNILSHCNKH